MSLSLSPSEADLPSRLRLPHDIVQEILLLVLFMGGSMRQYSSLCLVCRDWHRLLNEPYAWAALARRFVPAFPLIHTARFVPIVVPDALSSLSGVGLHTSPVDSSQGHLPIPPHRRGGHALGSSPSASSSAVSLRGGTPSVGHNSGLAHSRSRSSLSSAAVGGQSESVVGSRTGTPSPAVGGFGSGAFGRMASQRGPLSPVDVSAGRFLPPPPLPPPAGGVFHPSAIRKSIGRQWARRRRQVLRSMREVVRRSDEADLEAMRREGAVPTRATVRAAVEGLREYRQWLAMSRVVAQRRRFVLQAWMSAGLFFATCAVGADVCAAEGWRPASFCDFDVGFSFFYLAYLCVFGVAISNVFMATHYEPLALIPRVSRNTSLIAVSAVFLVAWILGVIVPTYLIQLKVTGVVRRLAGERAVSAFLFAAPQPGGSDIDIGIGVGGGFGDAPAGISCAGAPMEQSVSGEGGDGISWTQTIVTLTTAMGMWQVGVIGTLWGEVVGWARRPSLGWRHVGYIIPHMTPTLLAGSALAFARYLDTGSFFLLAITVGPLLGIFGILTAIFAVDAYHHGRESDVIVAIALGNIVATLLLVLASDQPRGLHGAPVFVCSLCLFGGQMRSMLKLLDSVRWEEDLE